MVAAYILGTGCLHYATAGRCEEQITVCTPWCLGECQCEYIGSDSELCGDHSRGKSPDAPQNQGLCLGAVS